MNEADLNLDMALIEIRLTSMLLVELVDSLRARQLLTRADVAGALLRTEFRATNPDEWSEEASKFIDVNLQFAESNTKEWSHRFALAAELYTLQEAQKDWLHAGKRGKSPLYPGEVISRYSTDEDGLILHIADLVPWNSARKFERERS
ncbi:hypothetical protein IFT84_10130 [Rhizobium sp. CFBP 8762]|uniref:hypothetical protein n=1 Tax=Rhizobium sp. CFBP 8762 TaxID=2775279 RepID=UPI001783006D|nr:hypothetical protein [Rhizobium sp. CFBP 8762]MBD8554881.1 hypothetical protein [Rhizobium sp. CFBP 8762]